MIFFKKMLPEIYAKFRFGSFGFVSVNPTKISVSVVSAFSRFGRPLTWKYTLSESVLVKLM